MRHTSATLDPLSEKARIDSNVCAAPTHLGDIGSTVKAMPRRRLVRARQHASATLGPQHDIHRQ